jgi:protein Mpv17
MIAGLKVWPLVSFLSFSVVPVDQRVLFGSMFGFAWAIYLSLATAA